MKKIFLAIYFIALNLWTTPSTADVIPLVGMDLKQHQLKASEQIPQQVPGMPDPNDQEAVRSFFKKRLEEVPYSKIADGEDWSSPGTVNIIHTPEYYEKLKESNKSTFQKIYDEALEAMHKKNESENSAADNPQEENEAASTATRFFTIAPNPAQQPQIAAQNRIPTVSVTLPSGKKILAPAREHIPYFLSYIDIQSNGYIKVEDTITIVANGKKFAYGLNRIFPKYTYYQSKRNHRIELLLQNVTVNGVKVPYIAEDIGNNIMLKPKYNQKLEPGVYTYKFNYLINNKLQQEDGLIFLDWNMTGRPLNAFITSANAIITIPEGHAFTDRQAFVGRENNYTNRRTNIFNLAKNVLAFSNTTPLLNGESMTLVTVMNPIMFLNNYDRNYNSILIDWGSIIYASLGLITILGSFLLSLLSLKKERRTHKYNPSYSGSLMRSILIGKYDRIAFIAQLLELYRKNALDITEENGRIFLHRQNTGSKLSKNEKKALQRIFPKGTSQTEINNANNLKFKKAKTLFEKNIRKQIKKYRLMHNIGYVLFSIAMLIITEFFIAFLSTNFAQSLTIMFSADLLFAFYIWILHHSFKHKLIALPVKLFSLLIIAAVWLFSSIYIGMITSILIIAMIGIIFEFSHIFGEHNNFINEAKTTINIFKEYLVSTAESINLSRDFANQQSNIFALGISENYPQNISNKNYYKLDIAENMKQSFIGIL